MTTTDAALLAGIQANPDFIIMETREDIAAAFADERDEVDTLLAFIAGDLDDTESANLLDSLAVASSAKYTDEELAQIDAEKAAAAERREREARLRKLREDSPCGKCGGAGRLPHYNYIAAGLCFRCDGTGIHAPSGLRADQ